MLIIEDFTTLIFKYIYTGARRSLSYLSGYCLVIGDKDGPQLNV